MFLGLAPFFGVSSEMQSQAGTGARSETMRAAEAGDDERFGMSLAADHARVVMFVQGSFRWGTPISDTHRPPPSSVANALETYRRHHPYLSFRAVKNGVIAAPLPATHCAAPVLNQPIDEWHFAGTYRDFERAFDRRLHHLENVIEGGTLGPPPAPESPMVAPIVINARMTTGLDVLLEAIEQVDGVVVIFREFQDKAGQKRCVRETYVRDATLTTLVGYDRNPERFARPVK